LRRSDRLFQIIQILRGARRPVTAAALAQELERHPRTIYRDVADLLASGVPIRGEAGVGYVIDKSYDLPPLMLTATEVEAALLGAQWVMQRGDPELVCGARDLIAKLEAVLPPSLQGIGERSGLIAVNMNSEVADTVDLALVRQAMDDRRKTRLTYIDKGGKRTERTIWIIHVAYFDAVRLIVAWCELRRGFRSFRTDQVVEMKISDERIPRPLSTLRREWWAIQFGSDQTPSELPKPSEEAR